MRGNQAHGEYREFEAATGKRILRVESFSSGMSGRVEGLICDDGSRFVAKAYPSRRGGGEALLREWRGLTELRSAGIRVPLPVHLHEAGNDSCFVMEWIEGSTFIDAWEVWGAEERERNARALLDLLSQTHGAGCPGLVIGGYEDTASFVAREIACCAKAIDRGGRSFLRPLISWLEEGVKALTPLPMGIIIRDLHPWNVLVNKEGELFLIDLDWDWGDPRFDLAWMLNTLDLVSKEDLALSLSRMIEEGPEAKAGGMEYFRVLARLRWLLDVLDSLEGKEAPSGEARERFQSFMESVIGRLSGQTGLALAMKDLFPREGM